MAVTVGRENRASESQKPEWISEVEQSSRTIPRTASTAINIAGRACRDTFDRGYRRMNNARTTLSWGSLDSAICISRRSEPCRIRALLFDARLVPFATANSMPQPVRSRFRFELRVFRHGRRVRMPPLLQSGIFNISLVSIARARVQPTVSKEGTKKGRAIRPRRILKRRRPRGRSPSSSSSQLSWTTHSLPSTRFSFSCISLFLISSIRPRGGPAGNDGN